MRRRLPVLDALGDRQSDCRRRQVVLYPLGSRAHGGRRNGEDDQVRGAGNGRWIGRQLEFDGQPDAGQVAAVLAVGEELPGLLLVARQQDNRTLLGQMQRESRAPRTGTNDRAASVQLHQR